MIWTEEAEKAVAKAPFFVRGKVRREVEKEASEKGSSRSIAKARPGLQAEVFVRKSDRDPGFPDRDVLWFRGL